MTLSREELLMKLGAARQKARAAWRLVKVEVAGECPEFCVRRAAHRRFEPSAR
jgi:hypothetical protein